MNKNQNGFSLVEVLIMFVIAALIIAAGWFVYDSQRPPKAIDTSTSKANNTPETQDNGNGLDTTYTDKTGHFSVTYPSGWKIETATGTVGDDPDAPTTTSTLTSPSGTKLKLNSDWGGKGGDCQPRKTDKPFKAGNNCPTVEYLSSEELPIDNVYYAKDHVQPDGAVKFTYEKAKINLTTSHYMVPDGTSQYIVGVRQSNPGYEIKVNNPVMGYLLSEEFITVYNSAGKFQPYIHAYATSPDATFLKSDDANTIKSILRSLTININ